MSDPVIQSATEVTPGLSQGQRLTNVFTAPSKTFQDIKNGHRSWWLPFIIMVVFGYLFFAAITMKVGWTQAAQNAIHTNPKAEEQMSQLPKDQQEMRMKFTSYAMEGGFAATPLIVLIAVALASLVLWGTINFAFGGKATFGEIFAVYMYAGLPGVLKTILGTVVLFLGMAPESFNVNNFAPTNLGAFLSPTETSPALYKLATAIDFTTIWSMVLLGIGIAIVAKVKRTSGYIAVFGWWAVVVICSVGWAALMG